MSLIGQKHISEAHILIIFIQTSKFSIKLSITSVDTVVQGYECDSVVDFKEENGGRMFGFIPNSES